ncbi:MAG: YraN family protein [Byssovorax sp.]
MHPGADAEEAAARALVISGLTLLDRNVRVGRLEIDLLMRDGPVIVVVEVRARGPGSFLRPLDSIDAPKRIRVRRAGAQLWSERFADDPTVERMRFDVVGVTHLPDGEVRIEHVKGAF